jgi:hypothetical protein
VVRHVQVAVVGQHRQQQAGGEEAGAQPVAVARDQRGEPVRDRGTEALRDQVEGQRADVIGLRGHRDIAGRAQIFALSGVGDRGSEVRVPCGVVGAAEQRGHPARRGDSPAAGDGAGRCGAWSDGRRERRNRLLQGPEKGRRERARPAPPGGGHADERGGPVEAALPGDLAQHLQAAYVDHQFSYKPCQQVATTAYHGKAAKLEL